MDTTKKNEFGINAKGEQENASGKKEETRKVTTNFTRPHVDEQARRALMEKYKYSDKYHD